MGLKKDPKIDSDLIPVWFELPQGFYKRLRAIADECGLSRKEAIQNGLRLLLREHRKNVANRETKKGLPEAEGAALGALRWENIDKAERSRIGRELAMKRWEKK